MLQGEKQQGESRGESAPVPVRKVEKQARQENCGDDEREQKDCGARRLQQKYDQEAVVFQKAKADQITSKR